MNKIIGIIAIVAIVAILLLNGNMSFGGVVQDAPTYSTASSTLYSLGHQLSTKVLDSYSKRAYARICNDTANSNGTQDIYLSFSSTAITATTSADQVVLSGLCFEINRDNLYTGEVQIITETSTSTGTFVTELRD